MTSVQLREEIDIEIDYLCTLVEEINSLRKDVEGREPTIREKTAAAAFLAQFYGGIENILKRIHRYYGLTLPIGDTWHLDLFKRFCLPGHELLPLLFDQKLARELAPFRKFRHVVHHGYGFQVEWERIIDGLESVDGVLGAVKLALKLFVDDLQ